MYGICGIPGFGGREVLWDVVVYVSHISVSVYRVYSAFLVYLAGWRIPRPSRLQIGSQNAVGSGLPDVQYWVMYKRYM